MSKVFLDLWLKANTRIEDLKPWQIGQVRALCEKFFEKGRAYERSKTVVTSTNNQLCSEAENDQHQS